MNEVGRRSSLVVVHGSDSRGESNQPTSPLALLYSLPLLSFTLLQENGGQRERKKAKVMYRERA
ncbi:hypothetical protein TorRG33x02_147400 [Trema orientale]|uniref:Uncharacterized protein n=1 Tax=Trema orientale TaxID=63057 RepID=A0A2P5EV19_TREOI|nr:hypothetical protein TorRG33x02_147400 [Trema orientale]